MVHTTYMGIARNCTSYIEKYKKIHMKRDYTIHICYQSSGLQMSKYARNAYYSYIVTAKMETNVKTGNHNIKARIHNMLLPRYYTSNTGSLIPLSDHLKSRGRHHRHRNYNLRNVLHDILPIIFLNIDARGIIL